MLISVSILGTGTPAGDPIEAAAIHDAFFPEDHNPSQSKLYVGSIKTIIGHLEGAAGLAGLLKASLAMKNGIIPPNMLFNQLNPKIRPFYNHLCVPTSPVAWPDLPNGVPKRASVNSFGFGGTNAHAIIEAWEPPSKDSSEGTSLYYGPFIISGYSSQAIAGAVANLSNDIASVKNLNIADLGYTLSRRSQFSYRASFSATGRDELVRKLGDAAQKISSLVTRAIPVTETSPLRVLGVFTGQGAQWPEMGADLYRTSALFRETIKDLEVSLASLPDPPSWSLTEQILASKTTSRIHESFVSQPLCTALQVALVDLLRASGITFSAVVGHSSGEIGAAYAAGHLSGQDAIRIAYYRGIHAVLAKGFDNQPGKMMAVGMSHEEATEFCSSNNFAGRIAVAASNARSSVTLSGDADAIDEALANLTERKMFARLLKVDTAYHSHHMKRCAVPYLDSLRSCNIQIRDGHPSCAWYSSVYGLDGRSVGIDVEALKGQYWVDNMVKTVLFSQAVQRAVTEEHCHDMVLEVGPHPALKGPASETLNNLTGANLPYSGVLKRGENDFNTFCDALGFVWKHFISPKPLLNFEGLRKACAGDEHPVPRVLKNLPGYSWDHDKILWKESRKSKAFRTRSEPVHELLGTYTVNGQNEEMRWRNVMKLNELDWLRGHVFQGQTLFPAGGYVAMAFEAAIRIAQNQPIALVDLHDLTIQKAITLDSDSAGTEVTFVIRSTHRTPDKIDAEYSCFSGDIDATGQDTEVANFHGKVTLTLGPATVDALPARTEPTLPMEPVDLNRLYSCISQIGLDYSGLFLTDSVKRRLNMATVTAKRLDNSKLRVHPATLDACFHSIFAAFSWPGDGRLWSSYLPTSISSVRVNMACPQRHAYTDRAILADCNLSHGDHKNIIGDIDIFCTEHGHAEMQVRGLTCTSFTQPRPQDDRKLYAKNVWKRDLKYGLEPSAATRIVPASTHSSMAETFERTAYFYLRTIRNTINREEVCSDWHMQHLMHWVLDHLLPQIESGKHSRVKAEWATDTEELILKKLAAFSGQIECELMKAVGENLSAILKGETAALQVLFQDNMLGKLYTDGLGFKQANIDLAATASQLTHRYPRMNILEIGAGTGGATRSVLSTIGSKQFHSYTYTDISAGFFEKAADVFSDYSDKMIFKVLNIEKDPLEQGFVEHSFDLIIASNVLHATKVLAETMNNCRRLLRPGGFLMLLEITSDALRPQFIVSSLPGWFLGIEDGRVWAPTVSEEQWDDILKTTGFSGVDTTTRDSNNDSDYCFSVITSQALDDRVALLRSPLDFSAITPKIPNLIVIGGCTGQVANVASRIGELLKPIADQTTFVPFLDQIEQDNIVPLGASVICLADLDMPVFENMTSQAFNGLQRLFNNARHLLWITQGSCTDNPYSNMIVGLGRSILLESKYIRPQFIDVQSKSQHDPTMYAEGLIRLVCSGLPGFQDVLWSTEHEIAIVDDAVYIPRILPNEDLNNRLNCDRRLITEALSPDKGLVEVSQEQSSIILRQTGKKHASSEISHACIQIEASSTYPFMTTDNLLVYLCVGVIIDTGKKVIAFSQFNTSIISVPKENILEFESAQDPVDHLHKIIVTLISESVVDGVVGRLWIHQPSTDLIDAIIDACQRDRVEFFFTTSQPPTDERLTFVHPYISKGHFEDLMPSDVEDVLDMQTMSAVGSEKHWTTFLKPTIGIRSIFQETENSRSIALSFDSWSLRKFMKRYRPNSIDSQPTRSIGLAQLSHSTTDLQPTTVVDWRSPESVSLPICPVNHSSLFSANKTYLLVGLTGDLGLSLCDWMIDQGARHIVLTSRCPRVHAEVFKHLQRKGTINIKVMAVDVSDRPAMTKLVDDIRNTMPPIAGVANAAMVLRDKAFQNMTWEDFQTVLAPKVEGSKILDELFSESTLDFFIMFSSLASIIGNSGQSNYGAANMFMTGLAYRRRARGLPASIIHIAMLLGVGYVARSIDQYETTLMSKYKYMAISETGFRSIFAEAIVAGRPDMSEGSVVEIITGLSEDSEAPWRGNPRFSHFEQDETSSNESSKKKSTSTSDLSGQLADAGSDEEMLAIIETGFSRKLELVLQISSDKIDKDSSLINLGIDSLVAVEIRSWFLKELNVDMPVLKILSDTSLTTLCKDIMGRLKGQSASQNKDKDVQAAAIPQVTIDWDREITTLCADLPTVLTHEAKASPSEKFSIILTGATGFLGKHILERLVSNELVETVHCVAIRRDSQGNARHLNVQSPKIREYPGDLGQPLLGLSQANFDTLSNTANAIIHNGADVSFLKSYQALKATNVLSTKTLIELATPNSVPLHFISTAAVALFTPEKELAEISAANLKLPGTGDRGYALSKWVNEVLLEKASSQCRVPSVIHRAVNIVGEGAPETDLMTALDTYTKVLSAVPDLRGNAIDGDLDIVEVDEVADGIISAVLGAQGAGFAEKAIPIPVSELLDPVTVPGSALSLSSSSPSSSPPSTPPSTPPSSPPSLSSLSCDLLDNAADILSRKAVGGSEQELLRIINYCSDVKVKPEEIRPFMERRLGTKLDELPFQVWLEKSHDLGMNRLVNFFLQDMLRQGKPIASPCLRKGEK